MKTRENLCHYIDTNVRHNMRAGVINRRKNNRFIKKIVAMFLSEILYYQRYSNESINLLGK